MVSIDWSGINWLAVVAAGFVAWIVGGIWFAPPVFGRRWMAALGMKPDQAGNPGPAFGVALVLSIVGALFLRIVLGFAEASIIADGILIALLIWFGFVLIPNLPGLVFKKGSSVAFGIEMGQHAIAIVVMGITLTVWT